MNNWLKDGLPEYICEFCKYFDKKNECCTVRDMEDVESALVCKDYKETEINGYES